MKELRARIEKAIELQESSQEAHDEREVEFESWLKDLKESVGLSENDEATDAANASVAAKSSSTGISSAGIPKPRNFGKPGSGPLPRLGGGLGRPAGGLGRPAGSLGRPAGGFGIGRPGSPQGARPSSQGAAVATATPSSFITPFPSGQLPSLAADDPRIGLCRKNIDRYDRGQLESLQNHLQGVYSDAQKGSHEGFISDYEANVIREFYAAFCLALDAYKSESGKFKNETSS